MTTLPNRTTTALLVIDMQRSVVADAFKTDRVISNIAKLVERARAAGAPVVWIAHEDDEMPKGSDGWCYVDALQRFDSEPLVEKRYGDSFEETDLHAILSAHSVGHVVVTGAQTDACVRSTLHGALTRGYDTTLVGDAHTTIDLRQWGSPISPEQAIAYTNLYWKFSSAPGRQCATANTTDVQFSG